MHHSVAYSLDLVEALDDAILGIGQDIEHLADSLGMVGHRDFDALLRAISEFELDEGIGEADLFDATFGEDLFRAVVDELILNARAAIVENKNFHEICMGIRDQ